MMQGIVNLKKKDLKFFLNRVMGIFGLIKKFNPQIISPQTF